MKNKSKVVLALKGFYGHFGNQIPYERVFTFLTDLFSISFLRRKPIEFYQTRQYFKKLIIPNPMVYQV